MINLKVPVPLIETGFSKSVSTEQQLLLYSTFDLKWFSNPYLCQKPNTPSSSLGFACARIDFSNWHTEIQEGEIKRHCLSSVLRPPSTATVIGIQGDGESLLEERRGGDSQKGCSGETGHTTSHCSALLSHAICFSKHLQRPGESALLLIPARFTLK